MGVPVFKVDAFTDRPFAGNPAAVCLLPEPREEVWMQNVAREMNLSETAFLVPEDGAFRLRWFTPSIEVALCGHATLASAHVLWEQKILKKGESACFNTRSGRLTAKCREFEIELNFPAMPEQPCAPVPRLSRALGAQPLYFGRNEFDYLVMLENEDAVRGLAPDFNLLSEAPVRGVIVTAQSSAAEFDFVSRFFAPAAGINEDPVTGSAHCCLAPFWQSRLGKNHFRAHQISARGGVLNVSLSGDRVLLAGKAITVLRGELLT